MRFLIALLLTGCLVGQITTDQADTLQFYSVQYEAALTGQAFAFSLQAPANNARRVYPKTISIFCSMDCVLTQDLNGTAATATEITTVTRTNTDAVPTAKAYGASNAGVGSALPKYEIKAGNSLILDLGYTVFARGRSGVQNYNVRSTGVLTGTVRVAAAWGERP